jgi:hypothetical protein
MKLMYVAGAYTGKTKEEVDLNIECAKKVGQVVVRKGWYPAIPHANTAGFDRTVSEVTYQFWIDGTLELMRRCDAVIMCPGWESSNGARGEHEEARRLKMPIYYETRVVPDLNVSQFHVNGDINIQSPSGQMLSASLSGAHRSPNNGE